MSTGNLSVVVLCSLSSKRTEQQQCGVMEVSIIPDHCRNVLLLNVVSCIWNGFGRGVRLYRCLIDSYRWPVFLWGKKKDQACVDQRVKAARRLLWITLDKQVCAKIVLVQTDHSKYYRRCLGPCLGSACFEGKQWTHNPSPLEETSAVWFYVVTTLVAYMVAIRYCYWLYKLCIFKGCCYVCCCVWYLL